ncbi:MAG: hypothetical protein FJZ56_00055 [Chlamydiae bacterium]|nr:hypothetical protein [Chlamydiota bacterium]
MKKQRPFVLIEILIAIALLALCLIPICSAPFRQYVKQIESLRKIELERISDLAYRDFLIYLAEHETFDSLPLSKKQAKQSIFGPYTIVLGKEKTTLCNAKVSYFIKKPKKPENHAMLRIEIEVDEKLSPSFYDLFIEKKPSTKHG